jgi:hypothetical protein
LGSVLGVRVLPAKLFRQRFDQLSEQIRLLLRQRANVTELLGDFRQRASGADQFARDKAKKFQLARLCVGA